MRGTTINLYFPDMPPGEVQQLRERLNALATAVVATPLTGPSRGRGTMARLLIALDAAYRRDPAAVTAMLHALLEAERIS